MGYGEIKLQRQLPQESRAVRPLRHDLTDRLKPVFTDLLIAVNGGITTRERWTATWRLLLPRC